MNLFISLWVLSIVLTVIICYYLFSTNSQVAVTSGTGNNITLSNTTSTSDPCIYCGGR